MSTSHKGAVCLMDGLAEQHDEEVVQWRDRLIQDLNSSQVLSHEEVYKEVLQHEYKKMPLAKFLIHVLLCFTCRL